MEEIKVNDYVRTKEHGIFKVLKFVKTSYGYYWGINDKGKAFTIGKGGNLEVEITKHSENIIDLIEPGDYVNGIYVRTVHLECEKPYIKLNGLGSIKVYDEGINSIVTHEQFNSMKYEVE